MSAPAALPAGVSIVIPVFNSDETLAPLVEGITAVLGARTEPFEILLVDDGSGDPTWQRCADLAETHRRVRALRLSKNFGQHNALLAGLREARFAVTVTMDDDLQHPPEEIPQLLAALHDGADVVYGTPLELPHGVLRNVSSRVTKIAMAKAADARIARSVSAFRAFRTDLRASFDAFRAPYVSLDVLLSWGTTRFTTVTVRHDPRTIGASNYTFRKLVRHTLNMLTGFSVWPLRLASVIGFLFTIVGVGVLIYVLGTVVVTGRPVPGFAFLASITAIFSGATLFAIGVIGEYLARIFLTVTTQPPYLVRTIAGDDEERST
jgi:undecaprenyl-phosphate 4-deoxy-4-formamido-L-arabinose transferase